jgi:hypothetical protein
MCTGTKARPSSPTSTRNRPTAAPLGRGSRPPCPAAPPVRQPGAGPVATRQGRTAPPCPPACPPRRRPPPHPRNGPTRRPPLGRRPGLSRNLSRMVESVGSRPGWWNRLGRGDTARTGPRNRGRRGAGAVLAAAATPDSRTGPAGRRVIGDVRRLSPRWASRPAGIASTSGCPCVAPSDCLIEVGASAGLCRCPDKCAYRYGGTGSGMAGRCSPAPPRPGSALWRRGAYATGRRRRYSPMVSPRRRPIFRRRSGGLGAAGDPVATGERPVCDH